jgi:hypothetical protein
MVFLIRLRYGPGFLTFPETEAVTPEYDMVIPPEVRVFTSEKRPRYFAVSGQDFLKGIWQWKDQCECVF